MTVFSNNPYDGRMERLMTTVPNFKPRGVGFRFAEPQIFIAALASLRLFGHTARIIQNRLEDERKGRENSIDRKLRRKIEEKKQAHGLKQ